ncbi:MAG: helix-turn-helix domain-containing protein [Candidatus Hodarchaeales archaeon]
MLEIQHDCPFSIFSRNHADIEILLWCNNSQYDILELRGESIALEKAVNDIKNELGMIVRCYPEYNHFQLVIKRCECDKLPLSSIYNRHNCVELLPVKFFAGREVVNLIVTAEDAGLILEDICKENPLAKTKVLKLAPLKTVLNPNPLLLSLDDLKNNLSVRQLEAITSAYAKGYYELPRKVPVESLAGDMDIHRRTYEEHLRKAERKIMNLLIPSLNLMPFSS